MKLNIPDKHMTISNILMALTLISVAGGAIGVIFQQVLMLVITVAVLAAFALAIYAIVMTIMRSGGVVVSYEEPTYTEHVHVHHHYHRIAEQPQQQPQQRMIEQQPTRYTVLPQPQQRMLLAQQQYKRLEVKR